MEAKRLSVSDSAWLKPRWRMEAGTGTAFTLVLAPAKARMSPGWDEEEDVRLVERAIITLLLHYYFAHKFRKYRIKIVLISLYMHIKAEPEADNEFSSFIELNDYLVARVLVVGLRLKHFQLASRHYYYSMQFCYKGHFKCTLGTCKMHRLLVELSSFERGLYLFM